MQNKRLYIIIGVLIVVVAAAAFVGGRLLNGQAGPLGMLPFGGNGGFVSVAIHMTRATELPAAEPEMTGIFVSRDDNAITLQSIGDIGGVVNSAGGAVAASPADVSSGPKVEVVITSQTKIWRDATEFSGPPSPGGGEVTVQQQVAAGSLDDLTSQSMVMVWGRKNGDRIIADVISYSNPVMFKRP